mgnify:CR=1 FL=1
MANLLNLPTAEQFDMQNALLASIASHVGTKGIQITSFDDLQRITRMGLHSRILTIGDQFECTYNSTPIVLDVIGIDHDIPTDTHFTHSLTLQPHNVLLNAQFDAPEALYYAETELAAGLQVFLLNSVKYKFTTGQAVPAGGQVFVKEWQSPTGAGEYVPTKVTTYAANRTTVIETDLAVTAAGEEEITLTPVNHHQRCKYGSDNYKESAVRQFLNSTADTFAWTPQTNYDRPSTGTPYNGAGFLKLLDPDLVAVLGTVNKQVARNTVTDGGGQDTFTDKVFLLSKVEVYGGTEGTTTGENPYPYYASLAPAPTADPLAGRIKYLSGSARTWWLRSPLVGGASHPRSVGTSGYVSDNSACYAYGLAPACCII